MDREPIKKETKNIRPTETAEPEVEDEKEQPISFKDLSILCLARNYLERHVEEPWFNECIVGYFVRFGIGKNGMDKAVYRLTQIIGIKKRYL